MENTNKTKHTLLAVLAHPDDESFGVGGTLALYAGRGVEVHLICATRGEAGEVGPEYLKNHNSISELREAELRCAAIHLAIREVHFLDYRDSGMTGSPDNNHPQALAAAPVDEVAAKIAHLIRDIKPQVVITFDPIGGYRHPDHIAMHLAGVRAFEMASDPEHDDALPPFQPHKLYYHTISRWFLRLSVRLLRLTGKDPSRWGKNQDIDLTTLAINDFPVHARINYRPVENQKTAASTCHASQGGGGLSRGPFQWLFRLLGGTDTFMRAYPPPVKGVVETDLFDGIP